MLADWDEIAPATEPGARNVRLADSAHPLDFRIGRDFRGRYVFQLDAFGLTDLQSTVPKIAGIECELEELPGEQLRLSLTLGNAGNFPNFRLMCTGLMLATDGFSRSRSEAGMSATIRELHRWQEMLRLPRNRLLSRSEIIGLAGEILFLRDILQTRLGILLALRCWNGPEGHEQDFVLASTIFEVKTQLVTADRRIRISSEDQLDPVQGHIMICNQGLAPQARSEQAARTLQALVTEIRALATAEGPRATDLLDIALLRAGYDDREEYDEEAWILVDRALYAVKDDFPRIERADLRHGVEMVSYSIRVADCQRFAVDLEDVMAELC
jgi:hypothetical protein